MIRDKAPCPAREGCGNFGTPFASTPPMRALLLLPLFAAFMPAGQDRALLKLQRSEVVFLSEAPMERITATNTKATGLIDPAQRTFVVRITSSAACVKRWCERLCPGM